MKLHLPTLLVGLFALCLNSAYAEDNASSAEATLPKCALDCTVKSLSMGICDPTDLHCICTDKGFNAVTSECVEANCTIREGLTTLRYTHDLCNAPVRDMTKVISYVGVSGGIISLIVVALRLLVRLPYFGGEFGWDDFIIILATIVMIPLSVCSPILANLGLGRDIWTVEFSHITEILKIYYFDEIWYVTGTSLAKISILFFYLRLFTTPSFRFQVFTVMALCAAYNITFVFAFVFQCKPLNLAWLRWDGEHEGKCLDVNAIGWAQSGFNMLLDVLVISLPLPQIAGLNLRRSKKIPLMLVFGLGFFITICSVIRIKYIQQFANSKNITWDYVPIGYWSTIETHLGIIIACLPALRALFIRIFPGPASESCDRSTWSSNETQSSPVRSSNRFSIKPNPFVQLQEFEEDRNAYNVTQSLPPDDGYRHG